MTNPLDKFRKLVGVEEQREVSSEPLRRESVRRQPVSLARKLLRPSARIKGREVEATERREYQDPDTGIYRIEVRRHRAYGRRSKGRGGRR